MVSSAQYDSAIMDYLDVTFSPIRLFLSFVQQNK